MSSVWYFAYGSNMQRATFTGRRGIIPKGALAARLAGWRLVLDKPPIVPVGESMANVVADPGGEVLGVAYELTAEGLARVDLTEGVLIGNYRRVEVAVATLAEPARTIAAWTLTSDRRDPTLRPSRRYLAALIEGAEEHGLPAAYVAALRAVPTGEESALAAEFRALVMAAWQQAAPSLPDGRRVTIRRASLDEIFGLRHRELRPGRASETARFDGDEEPTTCHYGAFVTEERAPVGCVSFMARPHAGEPAYQLRGMATRAGLTRRGIGSALLAQALPALPEEARARLLWCNARLAAVPFYARLGWTVVSPLFEVPGVGPHHVMLLRR
jgi:GNAT superfamily N-acetyltransferase/cation transport regulator ChaC